MKRFGFLITVLLILFLNIFSCVTLPAMADVMPYYTGAISNETIGFLQVPQKFKLYLYPREDSQNIENISWTTTSVKLNKISGNWALATILDMGGQLKIGYIQWRENDGSIVLFPKLTN